MPQDSQSSALYYLMKYGYIHEDENSNTAALLSADGVKSAIKDFQVRGKHLSHARELSLKIVFLPAEEQAGQGVMHFYF